MWVIYFLNVGFPMYGGQTVNTFMSDEMQFNRTILGLGFSLFNLFQGLPGPLIGYTIQKKGARFSMAIAAAKDLPPGAAQASSTLHPGCGAAASTARWAAASWM